MMYDLPYEEREVQASRANPKTLKNTAHADEKRPQTLIRNLQLRFSAFIANFSPSPGLIHSLFSINTLIFDSSTLFPVTIVCYHYDILNVAIIKRNSIP